MSAWSGSDRAARLPRTWPTIRRRVLRCDPTCRVCWSAPATEVDHIVPGDDHRETNLQGICSPCHASKSGREGGRAARPRADHPNRIPV
ncbi:HNH endonuclease [Amycolatopsis japonica]|uniref:HNH endonuclease n=1 Tax=Amycolatopsis TaxID=1813 RepID=UPI000938C749|nr:hypothetical protein AMK34_02960 [Amycolatopsis sp. CB00013]